MKDKMENPDEKSSGNEKFKILEKDEKNIPTSMKIKKLIYQKNILQEIKNHTK